MVTRATASYQVALWVRETSLCGYSTGLDRRFYGETVTLISTREIQDSERTSTQSKQFVRNDDTN